MCVNNYLHCTIQYTVLGHCCTELTMPAFTVPSPCKLLWILLLTNLKSMFNVTNSYDVIIPAQGELGSDIPAGDGKLSNLFLRCIVDMNMSRYEL